MKHPRVKPYVLARFYRLDMLSGEPIYTGQLALVPYKCPYEQHAYAARECKLAQAYAYRLSRVTNGCKEVEISYLHEV